VKPPEDGAWAAFFIQFEFPEPTPAPAGGAGEAAGAGADRSAGSYTLSTEVLVVPDTFPFPDLGTDQHNYNQRLVLAQAQ